MKFGVNALLFKRIIIPMLKIISNNEMRDPLKCICIESQGDGKISLNATDGIFYVNALIESSSETTDFSINIPKHEMIKVVKLIKLRSDHFLEIEYNGDKCKFTIDETKSISVYIMEKTFPRLKDYIHKTEGISFDVDLRAFRMSAVSQFHFLKTGEIEEEAISMEITKDKMALSGGDNPRLLSETEISNVVNSDLTNKICKYIVYFRGDYLFKLTECLKHHHPADIISIFVPSGIYSPAIINIGEDTLALMKCLK